MEHAQPPLISIIVTVYNLEDYIAQCLESLAAQREANFEAVLVDNGSTDRSVAICRDYARRCPGRIRLLELPAPGWLYRAHRAGLIEAKGAFVQFIDGDDYLEPDYLARACEILRARDPDVLMGRFTCFTQNQGLPYRDAELNREALEGRGAEAAIAYLRTVPAFHLAYWRYLFRRSLAGDDLFASSLPENRSFPLLDALVTTRILLAAGSFALLEAPFYHYRSREDSTSSAARKKVLWNAQGWIEFLLFLKQGSYQGGRRLFVLDKLYQELKLMLGSFDAWDDRDWSAVASQFSKVGDCGCLLREDVPEFLRRFGAFLSAGPVDAAGLKGWFRSVQQDILSRVGRVRPANLFVFPAGRYARHVHGWLISEGYLGVSFLDNNREMAGREIQGARCLLPSELEAMPTDEKEKSLVLIATIYTELDKELKNQCRALGMPPARVLIV